MNAPRGPESNRDDARHRRCPACSADDALPIYVNRMAPVGGLDMSYVVVGCRVCGFAYASGLPEVGVYNEYYRLLSKYDVAQSDRDIAPHDRERIRAAVALCRAHVRLDACVIDIGCGVGALLDGFRSAGYSRVHGLDPAPDASHAAARIFGLSTVRSGMLSDAGAMLPLDDVGLICMTGVLEHLPRLDSDLERLFLALPESAKVLIEVPALERFCHVPMEPYGEFSLEHLQYFDSAGLCRLMARFSFVSLDQTISAIPGLATDSLFALFVRDGARVPPLPSTQSRLAAYVELSENLMQAALARSVPLLPERFWIYGAGSHTARLLPRFAALGLDGRVAGVIDGNRNLHGRTIGRHRIHPPQFLEAHRGQSVLISSFRAQQAIAQALDEYHPLVLMYP